MSEEEKQAMVEGGNLESNRPMADDERRKSKLRLEYKMKIVRINAEQERTKGFG